MKLEELTMSNLIKEKTSYVVPSIGKTFDKLENAEKIILDTCNIGQYYKFYEVFYSPSLIDRNKRYTKFMMIMTRRTVAIKNEVYQYLTEYMGLDAITDCGEFGLRDTFIINENNDLNTATKVYNQIVKNMKINGGLEPGGNEIEADKIGTLHLINASGLPIHVGSPENAKEIFNIYVNFDESKLDPEPPKNPDKPKPENNPSLDSNYV